MELDTRTTIVAGFAVAGLLAGTALTFARGTTPPLPLGEPLRLWGYALLMLAIGLAGVALRDAVPHVFSIVLSNTLVVAALVMSYRSLRAFRGPPPADYVGWSLVVVVFAALWLLLDVWP